MVNTKNSNFLSKWKCKNKPAWTITAATKNLKAAQVKNYRDHQREQEMQIAWSE